MVRRRDPGLMAVSEPSLFDEIDEIDEIDDRAEADARAEADVTDRRVISRQAMKTWFVSCGTSEELPPPEVGD